MKGLPERVFGKLALGEEEGQVLDLECAPFFSARDGNGASKRLVVCSFTTCLTLYITKMIAKSAAIRMQQKALHIRFK